MLQHERSQEHGRHDRAIDSPESEKKQKTICMLAYSHYEFDNRIKRYAETLAKRGDHVDVIALNGTPSRPPMEEVRGVTVYRIQTRDFAEKGKWSYAWRLLRFLFASSLFLIRLHRQYHYDVIHVHNMPDFLVFAAWYAKLHGVRIILDLHDLTPELFGSKFGTTSKSPYVRLLKLVERMSCRFADHVIVSNDLWGETVKARSVPTERCSVIINHVDLSIFYRRQRERSDQRFIIMFHGAYQWHQGLDIAIEAFALVKPRLRAAELHFYGGGRAAEREDLEKLSRRLGVSESVKFCGSVPIDSIPAVIANADLGVVPKRANSFGNEAYSTKIMEFMSQGVPVVLSKTKIDAFYFDEGTVHFFPSGDIQALADAILDVANNEELRDGLIARGLEYVERNAWDTKREEYLDLVDALSAKPKRPSMLSHRQRNNLERKRSIISKDEAVMSQQLSAGRLLTDYFRCPDSLADLTVAGDLSAGSGYFRFGSDITCFGQCSSGTPSALVTGPLHDALEHVSAKGSSIQLPFDPNQVVDNLRYERYRSISSNGRNAVDAESLVRRLYYLVRPFMGVSVRKYLQRLYLRGWNKIPFPSWPVDLSVDNLMHELLAVSMKSRNVKRVPFIWFWPEAASSCAIMTHDVETAAGRDFCVQLMDLDDSFGIKSAFQIIPEERYSFPQAFLDCIQKRGFEVNVHDLNHDGHLFDDRAEFLRRARQINDYGRKFGSSGFRSAVLYRNLDWFDALEFSYDMSIPNTGQLEAERGGCCTVLPFFNGRLLEIPVTMTQDYVLFHVLKDYSIELWKQQIEVITEKHGLLSVIVHPDYIIKPRARGVYEALLGHLVHLKLEKAVWITTPGEVDQWWRQRAQMSLVEDGGGWRIEGMGKERARVAYACEEEGRLAFTLEEPSE